MHLGREIERRAALRVNAGLGHAGEYLLGQAQVAELDHVLVHEDIRGLDVAVHHLVGVQIVDAAQQLEEPRDHRRLWKRVSGVPPGNNSLLQVTVIAEVHDNAEVVLGAEGLAKAHQVRVDKLSHVLDLADAELLLLGVHLVVLLQFGHINPPVLLAPHLDRIAERAPPELLASLVPHAQQLVFRLLRLCRRLRLRARLRALTQHVLHLVAD